MNAVPPPVERAPRRLSILFRLALAIVIVAVIVLVFAQVFSSCLISFPTNMNEQPSFGYVEPPRGQAPAEAVPFGEPHAVASLGAPLNPVTFSPVSQERGNDLYDIYCLPCHGEPEAGQPGQVGALFQPPPPDLSASAGRLSDGQIFTIITSGIGRMPALGASLAPLERWDVTNFLRGFAPGPPPPAGPAQNAARNYSIQCAQCHGPGGEGALGTPLFPSAFLIEGTPEEIGQFIKVGRRQRGMPPFAGRMTDVEIHDLALLLKDLQQDGPTLLRSSLERLRQVTTTTTTPAAATTTTTVLPGATTTTTVAPDQALLDLGERVFDANCVSCHGPDGVAGGIGPPLQPNQFVAGSPDPAVRQIIEQGRPGTAMPPFEGRLGDQEIDALVALLRSWQGSGPQGMTDIAAAAEEEDTLDFSHKKHTDRGIGCLFCHFGARRAPSADLPSLELCAGCHRWISTQTEATREVLAAVDEQRTVSWRRVYRQPEFVYFSHRPHIAVAGLPCATCHGEVGEMTLARRVKDLNMGFCLDCHEKTNYELYRETGEATFMEGILGEEPATGNFLTDCHICHK